MALVLTLCFNSDEEKEIIGKNMRHIFSKQRYEITILRAPWIF
jgi:hypothetical protein